MLKDVDLEKYLDVFIIGDEVQIEIWDGDYPLIGTINVSLEEFKEYIQAVLNERGG